MNRDETGTFNEDVVGKVNTKTTPALLLVHAPPGAAARDNRPLEGTTTVGRTADCDYVIHDGNLSRRHFKVAADGGEFTIEDLGSKNGTFVDGVRVVKKTALKNQAVIRAGRTLLVFHPAATDLARSAQLDRFGLVGRFHASMILGQLARCRQSRRHVLIAGPSGSGKELAAHAFAAMMERPLLCHNAARFASGEEATTTLFGVRKNFFSNVDPRVGLIEEADGGALFLDEAHVLPGRVQKSLLRVMEDATLSRFGENRPREVDVRFILASNEPPPAFGLEPDLLNRLRVVTIPALSERKADIPGIFDHLLQQELARMGRDPAMPAPQLSTGQYELMMVDGFETENVRGLLDIADRIASRMGNDEDPLDAVHAVFVNRYGQRKYSVIIPEPAWANAEAPSDQAPRVTADMERPYGLPMEDYREIEEAYRKYNGNVTVMYGALKEKGLPYSRKKIARVLDEMGLPRLKRPRK